MRKYEEQILDELESIPESELPKLLEIIKYFKVGITSNQVETKNHKLEELFEMEKNIKHEKEEISGRYFNIQDRAE